MERSAVRACATASIQIESAEKLSSFIKRAIAAPADRPSGEIVFPFLARNAFPSNDGLHNGLLSAPVQRANSAALIGQQLYI